MSVQRPGLSSRWAAAWLLASASAAATAAPDAALFASRGELLYANHCQGCHTSVLHVRDDHRARSVADVYDWVRHWSHYQELGWTDEESAAVTEYLVGHYYRFDPEPPAGQR